MITIFAQKLYYVRLKMVSVDKIVRPYVFYGLTLFSLFILSGCLASEKSICSKLGSAELSRLTGVYSEAPDGDNRWKVYVAGPTDLRIQRMAKEKTDPPIRAAACQHREFLLIELNEFSESKIELQMLDLSASQRKDPSSTGFSIGDRLAFVDWPDEDEIDHPLIVEPKNAKTKRKIFDWQKLDEKKAFEALIEIGKSKPVKRRYLIKESDLSSN